MVDVVVPDLGDFSDVEVIDVLVAPGDDIVVEAPLLTVETDKAAMDIPSPAAGKLLKLTVAVGDRVSAGDVIAVLEAASDAQSVPASDSDNPAQGAAAAAPDEAAETPRSSAQSAEQVAAPKPVTVPDLGDFANVEVIEVLVAAGDTVKPEQGLITVETEKAAMDVPASEGGVIVEMKVTTGDKVSAGDVVAILQPSGSEPVSVASGSSTDSPGAASLSQHSAAVVANKPAVGQSSSTADVARGASQAARLPAVDEARFGLAHASPSVRKLARELGVDLGRVQGSGVKQRITADDVKAYVKQVMLSGGTPSQPALPSVPEVDFAKFGEVDVVKLSRIQKISGPRLHASWVNLPHVTQHDMADITELETQRKALKADAEKQGVKLTPLAFILRACSLALEEFPTFKASLSADGESLVMKNYSHIGFAADTPNGLVVPVIRDADKKSVFEIAGELGELSALARDGKLRAKDMQGGVFTISSLGGIGGTYFTPIINAPEVAILGVSRSNWQPVYTDKEFVPRLMLPLSLSYDHRVIDGAQAARFITYLSAALGDVDRLLEAGE